MQRPGGLGEQLPLVLEAGVRVPKLGEKEQTAEAGKG